MAQIDNPQKSYMFGILAAGLNPFLVQEANVPDFEFESVEHGDVDYDVKTAGRRKYGTIKLTNLVPVVTAVPTLNSLIPNANAIVANWIWNWASQVRTAQGIGLPPSQYKKNLDIVQYGYDQVTITSLWECQGCWPLKINGRELSRTKSENSMDELELSVDKYDKRR